MEWFVAGGLIGVAVTVVNLIRRPLKPHSFGSVVGGFAIQFAVYAVVLGVPLWLIFG